MRVNDHARIAAIARGARVVAVLGAHSDGWRPANYVPAALHKKGVRIVPVNPRLAGQVVFGEAVRSALTEVHEAVDILDVFRRSEDVAAHVDEILAMSPLPKVVWLQSGIRDNASADRLSAAGIDVVQDRCLMVEAGA